MVKHFEEWFSKNDLRDVFSLLESYQITEAKLLCDKFYRQQRILLQAVSTGTAAIFGPLQYLYIFKVALIIDDRVSNEQIYLNLVRDILELIKQQILTSQQFEVLEVRTISGKTTGLLSKDIEPCELLESVKKMLLGAFDKNQKYWIDRVNESINVAFTELNSTGQEFSAVWILENSEFGSLKSSEVEKFVRTLQRVPSSQQILYSCFNCSNAMIENSQDLLFYHEFNSKTGTYKSELADKLLDLGSELRQLAKYISKLELELSNTQNVIITDENKSSSALSSVPNRPFLPLSSENWLKKYGLKACNLSFEKFLKSNTISKVTKTFVPALNKKVESKVFTDSDLVQYDGKNLSLTKTDTEGYDN